MSETANPLYRDKVARTRAGVAQGIEDRHARTHERSCFFRGYLVRNSRKCFRRCDHVFGVSAIIVDTRHLAINAHGEVAASTFLTDKIMAAMPAYANGIARFPGGDTRSKSINAAGNFVTWDPRILQARPEPFFYHYITMADPAGFHLDTHLPGTGFGNIAFHQLKFAAWFANLGDFHFRFHDELRAFLYLSAKGLSLQGQRLTQVLEASKMLCIVASSSASNSSADCWI